MTPRLLLIATLALAASTRAGDDLRTVAEKTDYKATARHADVVDLCKKIAEASKGVVAMGELGTSTEGRSIPLMIVADPPVKTPEEAKATGKLVVLLIGNIHAGEVDGKEALPMLVREIATTPDHPLRKDLILLVAPIYNADGNEKFSKTNRPGQVGPEEGMGVRHNGQDLDLNRDFVKLEAPETRGLLKILNTWDPHLFIDVHTTNGSYHRYEITYQGPKNPAGDGKVLAFTRDVLMPEAGARLEKATGYKSFFYGNFDRDHTLWTTYGATPRFGTTYVGMRDRLAVLSEAYSYVNFKTRVIASLEFCRGLLASSLDHKDEIRATLDAARKARPATIPIRSEARVAKEPVKVLGYVEEAVNGRPHSTKEPKEYTVGFEQDFVGTESVTRPFAYVIPPKYQAAIEAMKAHGFQVEEAREDQTLDAEGYTVEEIIKAPRAFEKHRTIDLKVTPKTGPRKVEAGSAIVKTDQPLGTLAVCFLEPRSDDGLVTWNFFDEGLKVGEDFPVLRLAAAPRPVAAKAARKKPITFDVRPAGGGRRGPGGDGPMGWIDGSHWLQRKDGKLVKVSAETGDADPFLDADAMTKALEAIPSVGKDAGSLIGRAATNLNPAKTAALLTHKKDLYFASLDGKSAVRLTNTPDVEEEEATFSPDGKLVAFVRDNDLYVSSTEDGKERRLTTGGSDKLRHGKADWVYYEEVFNRKWKAYWWSPDSKQVAFFETDDTPVRDHVVLADAGDDRLVETTPYPRPGAPNPRVRLGLVHVDGAAPVFVDPPGYPVDSTIISEVGWLPDGVPYCYVQDRIQTFLDIWLLDAEGRNLKRAFRDRTRAWIDSPGPLHIRTDEEALVGGLLFLSERDGWKHLYEAGDYLAPRRVTRGDWEITALHHVSKDGKYAYISATKDDPIASNLYCVYLNGDVILRLTKAKGSHSVSLSPDAKFYLDTWSDISTPPQTALFKIDGTFVRTITPPSSIMRDEYEFGSRELVKIPARDGFVLEGELILPPGMDPDSNEPHPVWFQTYGGPHAPTVSDAWNGGRLWEQALAAEGFVVFRADPRSASGKGAVSAWTAYKRLGVGELEDITDAINWLKKKPYVDARRIGMSGHSYGGFMTAYAMTHGDLFAAGIAGAPVTDWRDYDSIYTERLMLTPEENPKGYEESSVVKAARDLKGKLLILHGAIDDNVSVRNTLHLVQALQSANKDFEMMIYPSSRHGIFGPHYQRLQVDFIRRTLGSPKPSPSATTARQE